MTHDYIIAGAGCAGLSLLYRMLKEPVLNQKKILLIDKTRKNKNDRTWCFWEEEEGLFESIVRHQWKILEFKTESFSAKTNLDRYAYKMIRGIDFYNYVLELDEKFDNVVFKQEEVKGFDVVENQAIVKTNSSEYTAEYLFNSTHLMNPQLSKEDTLLQHFMGWEIKVEQPIFNPNEGTLMDFSLDQKHGTTFMYVLPVSETQALVEYTLFTGELLEKGAYKAALKKYIREDLKIEKYELVEEEYGVIPMSTKKFDTHFKERIIHIGTAGGQTKASSGYTFQFVQKHTEAIIERLRNGENPLVQPTYRDQMFEWYDRTLIEVIIAERMTGKEIFSMMFKKLPFEKILKFLGNESTFLEDISIMYTLPFGKFLPAGIKQMKRQNG